MDKMEPFRPKWTKWSRECQNPVRNKVILTKMVVWAILDLLVQYTFRQYRPLPTLRAKGTLISEPRFSTPLRDAIFPTRERENGLFKEKTLDKGHFPFLAWEKSHLAGGRNRGSLIIVCLWPSGYFRISCTNKESPSLTRQTPKISLKGFSGILAFCNSTRSQNRFPRANFRRIPREARDLISKIRSCTVRSDLKN